MTIAVLHRSHFQDIRSATARQVAANCWEITIPAADPIHKKVRRKPTAEGWDGAVFLIDDAETEPAVGSGESAREVRVTVFVV